MEKFRCKWCEQDDDLRHYHDEIWGTKRATDEALFEALTLEIFQAGLKWATIYHKRAGFRRAFAHYNIDEVAQFDEAKKEGLRKDASIIRHRMKIAATICNAKQILMLQQQYGSFRQFLDTLTPDERIPALRQHFKHVGNTTAESFLIACGYIPAPHEKRCYLYVKEEGKS